MPSLATTAGYALALAANVARAFAEEGDATAAAATGPEEAEGRLLYGAIALSAAISLYHLAGLDETSGSSGSGGTKKKTKAASKATKKKAAPKKKKSATKKEKATPKKKASTRRASSRGRTRSSCNSPPLGVYGSKSDRASRLGGVCMHVDEVDIRDRLFKSMMMLVTEAALPIQGCSVRCSVLLGCCPARGSRAHG